MERKIDPPAVPAPVPVDPNLKPFSYTLLKKFWDNGLVARFEIFENVVRWEFPIPTVDSSYHLALDVPVQRMLQEPLVVWAEMAALVYKDLNRIKGAMNPGFAAAVSRSA